MCFYFGFVPVSAPRLVIGLLPIVFTSSLLTLFISSFICTLLFLVGFSFSFIRIYKLKPRFCVFQRPTFNPLYVFLFLHDHE